MTIAIIIVAAFAVLIFHQYLVGGQAFWDSFFPEPYDLGKIKGQKNEHYYFSHASAKEDLIQKITDGLDRLSIRELSKLKKSLGGK